MSVSKPKSVVETIREKLKKQGFFDDDDFDFDRDADDSLLGRVKTKAKEVLNF